MSTFDASAISSMLDDLQRSLDNAKRTQQRMMAVTATAWSDDRLVKVVVGPRGQLIDLDIDPRVYRRPNSKALAAAILAAVRAATEQAMEQTQQILDEALPPDLAGMKLDGLDSRRLMRCHDADLKKHLEETDDV